MSAEAAAPLLEFRGVDAGYGDLRVLHGVDYRIGRGEIVCLLGGNASGKTTTMNTVIGLVRPAGGSVLFDGQPIGRLAPPARVKLGIAMVPEARRLFARMSVAENLAMGAHLRPRGGAFKAEYAADLDRVHTLFPRLAERREQLAGTLSGGEQQMVAIGRALMGRPRLICMDEPSMGLSPLFVEQVFETIERINRQGVTIFVVEQNAAMALAIAHHAYVLEAGRVVLAGLAADLRTDPAVRDAYLGEMAVGR